MRYYIDEDGRTREDNEHQGRREIEFLNSEIYDLQKQLRHELNRRDAGFYIANEDVRHLEHKLHDLYSHRDLLDRRYSRQSYRDEEDEDGNYSYNYNYQQSTKEVAKPSVKLEKVKMKARKFLK